MAKYDCVLCTYTSDWLDEMNEHNCRENQPVNDKSYCSVCMRAWQDPEDAVGCCTAGGQPTTIAGKYLSGDKSIYQPKSGLPGEVFTYNDGSKLEWVNGEWVLFCEAFDVSAGKAQPTADAELSESDRLLAVSKGQMPPGTKDDSTKPRWSLLPLKTIAQVIKVLEFGANKYSEGGWEHVDDAERRYYDAAMRHLDAWWNGEMNDKESGLPHLAHATACLLFLMWFDGKQAE